MPISPVAVSRSARFDSVGISLIVCGQGEIEGAALGKLLGSSPDSEQLRLYLVRSGECRLAGDQNDTSLRPGRAAVAFSGGLELTAVEDSELFVIDAPTELVTQTFGTRLPSAAFAIARDSQLLRPTISFAAQLLNDHSGEFSGLSSYYIERLLQEMLLGLLVDAKRIAKAPTGSDPFLLAQAVIQVRLSDPNLNTDEIAAEVRLSRRQLERLFHKNGLSVAGHVRRVRVEAAAEMLRDPSHSALGVDQIARYVGFSSGSSLARAMSAEGFGAPSSMRKRSA